MIISDHNRFIFVHIYKTAGSSLTKMLSGMVEETYRSAEPSMSGLGWQETWHYEGGQHWRMSYLRQQTGWAERDLSDYLFISFVRNPYSWVLSVWNDFYKEAKNPEALAFATMFPDRSFSSFCKFVSARNYEQNTRAWGTTTQGSFLADPDVNEPFIGRFESIDEDMQRLVARMGIEDSQVPHETRSNPQARASALDHYTPESIEIVNRVFREDFERFSYQTV